MNFNEITATALLARIAIQDLISDSDPDPEFPNDVMLNSDDFADYVDVILTTIKIDHTDDDLEPIVALMIKYCDDLDISY